VRGCSCEPAPRGIDPDEDHFDSFVTAHGGYSNAHTDGEETCFAFEVDPEHLAPSLDIFAQFFASPLMKPSRLEAVA
jgi:secreted Zn-dependent insulinase-like peptidase